MCWQCGRTFTTAMEVCPDDGARLIETDVEDREDPLLGSVFDGRFRIYGKLGEGGMGAVYSARRLDFETDVALKLLKLDFTRNEEIRKRFMYEARVISNLKHPHAIQVFDFGQTSEGHVYMVMELLEGESLADRLAYRFVTYREIFDIVPPICGVLGEAHTRDVVHRDLKPENIYLLEVDGNEEFPKLLDFGIAKHNRAETMTKSGTLWGTPAYMSPEQARGGSVGAPADIYGIGIMLYELISGNLPFNASTQMGYAVKHLNEPVRPPSSIPGLDSIPEALDEYVVRMLAKEPEQRPTSMEDVAETLAAIRQEHFDDELLDGVPAKEVDPIGLQRWLDEAPEVDQELPSSTGGEESEAMLAETAAMAPMETGDGGDEDSSEASSDPREMPTRAVEEDTETRRVEGAADTRVLETDGGVADEASVDDDAGGSRRRLWALATGSVLALAVLSLVVWSVTGDSDDVEESAHSVAPDVEPDREHPEEVDEEPGTPGTPLDVSEAAPSAAGHASTVIIESYGVVERLDPEEFDEDFDFIHGAPEDEFDDDELDDRRELREALEETF